MLRTQLHIRPSALAVFAAVQMACAVSCADLAWDKDRLEFSPEPGANEVVADYSFAVTGGGPLTITSVDTGCGCAGYELKQTEFTPGDRGSLRIKVNIGDREGLYLTPMLVHWQQGGRKASDTLFIRIAIPVLAKFSQRVLAFSEPKSVKTVTIDTSSSGIALAVGDVVGGYQARFTRADERKGTYELTVTAGELANGFVEVIGRRKGEVLKKWRIFLRVSK